VTNQRFADMIWDRLKHLVPPSVTILEGCSRYSKELEGTWVAIGLNPNMLFNRYPEGGHFSPHTDGYTIIDFNTRSMYSTLVRQNTLSFSLSISTSLFFIQIASPHSPSRRRDSQTMSRCPIQETCPWISLPIQFILPYAFENILVAF